MTSWDCIVVGGGAAGLSAALVLGRARRRTLVVDAGGQSNLAAEGIGGLLGYDGRPPAELYAAGRAELAAYPTVEVRDGEVVDGRSDGDRFELELADGTREVARCVLLATGIEYRHPELPGAEERWGRSVFHCPFCHGWEVRDQPLAVLGSDATTVERALMLRFWSDDVTLLGEPEAPDAERLADAGIDVDGRTITGLRGPGDTLTAVVFADGAERPCGGMLVPITLHQRSPLASRLGAEPVAANPMHLEAVEADAMSRTSVPGLFAAGDVTPAMPSVANAVAAGSKAAAAVVHALIAE